MIVRRALLSLVLLLVAGPLHAGEVDDIRHLVQAREYTEALARAERYLARTPKDAQVRFLRGLTLAELGRSQEAIKAFTSLSEDYPQLPEPYNNLAVLYAQQNQLDKARAALQLAIQTNPSYAVAHENLGDLYARMASQAYDKALQLEGQNRQVQTKLTLVRELFGGGHVVAPSRRQLAQAEPPAPRPTKAAAPQPTPRPPTPTPAPPRPTAAPKPTTVPKQPPAPTAVPTPAVAQSEREQQQVIEALQNWARAWSRQDFDGYLAAYSRKFDTPRGQRFADWAAERRPRVTGPRFIDVALSDIRIDLKDDATAVVRLRQSYRSDRLTSSTGKTLVLEKSGGRWLIREERT
ncbi:tetratricopeptide repeat protein [Chitiniphilus purpureus]|uniref:Tetratricopeptide repeat protein n=1 Tax=Chitiniphilus purpureus TaxID=2981137 RepID=A0ABY6DU62_9NEIS|nr:tetratricopeptide repeat protein [Chitiniphilus sp. CD1]UXY17036.1 tetratricopeptide repeat protein [Chitiniphilus sp. CD1]